MKQTHAITSNNKLVLHFDVQTLRLPKTNSNHLQIYELCSSWTWGKLQKNNQDNPNQITGWKAEYSNLSKQQPEQQAVSYKSYLQDHLKQTQHDYSDNLLNLTKVVTPQTKIQIEKYIKNTTLPKTLFEAIREEAAQQNQLLAQYKKTGKYHILPAFYKLLLNLKKNKKDFAIVVKNDNIKDNHSEIIFELNLFFSGEHPLFNGRNGTPLVKWDGSKGTRNFTVEQTHQTVVYMLGEKQLYSTYGTLNITEEKDAQMFKQKFKNFKNVKLCVGQEEIYEVQHQLLSDAACIYEINPYHALVLNQTDYLTHQIYFTASSQPCLYASNGGQIKNNEHYVINVDLFEQLRDIDYFIKHVASLQEARSKQMAQIEREDKPQPEKIGRQQSASLSQSKQSNFDYIKEKLLPVLEGAFRQVDLLRPEDPIAFIALYCLKNQDRFE